jgi:hypothetical protein
MTNQEFKIYTDNESEERNKLIIKMRESCDEILIKWGKVKKEKKKIFGIFPLSYKVNFFSINSINISSTSSNPKASEFIRVKVEKHIEELLLSHEDALIFEDWGMGENIYEEGIVTETDEAGSEIKYPNPRLATLEEIEPYFFIINQIKALIP